MDIRTGNKRILFLSLACIISNASYYPVLQSSGIGRNIAITVWIVLSITVIGRLFSTFAWTRELRSIIVLYAFFALNTFIVGTVNEVNAFDNHFFQTVSIAVVIFTVCTLIGIDVDIHGLRKICLAYFYSMFVISIPLFFLYLKNTNLLSMIYDYTYGKNEIAVLLLCALFICCTIYGPRTRLQKLIRIIGILFFIVDIMLLRTRSAMLGIGLLGVVIIFRTKTLRRDIRNLGLLAVIAVTIYFFTHPTVLSSFMNNIVYAGRNSADLNDLSSGRGDQILLAWNTIKEHPFFGVGKRFTCDCFYVSAVANYGLFSWPLIVMSFKPIFWSIKNYNLYDDVSLCYFLVSISFFFFAVLEELAPFGPGTRCYLIWLMWGILSQNKRIDREWTANSFEPVG